jgi:hypothetical protein
MKTQGDVSMTNARTALLVAIALAASAPGIVAAQKLEQARNVEPGDKIQFNWVLNGKAQAFEEEWKSANGDEAVGVQRTGGKEIPLVAPKVGTVSQATCLSNGQPCTFSPPVNFMELPLEKGKKWQQAFTVKGETFTSQVESEWQVDKGEGQDRGRGVRGVPHQPQGPHQRHGREGIGVQRQGGWALLGGDGERQACRGQDRVPQLLRREVHARGDRDRLQVTGKASRPPGARRPLASRRSAEPLRPAML